jgi:hypothetical protein
MLAFWGFPNRMTPEKLRDFFLENPKTRLDLFVRRASADWNGKGNQSLQFIYTNQPTQITSIRNTQNGEKRIKNHTLAGAVPLQHLKFKDWTDIPIDFARYAKEVNELIEDYVFLKP